MEWFRQRLIDQEGGKEWIAQITTWLSAIDAPFPPFLRSLMSAEAAHAAARPGSTAAAVRAQAEAAALTGEAALTAGSY